MAQTLVPMRGRPRRAPAGQMQHGSPVKMREPGQEVCWGGTLQVGLRFSSEPRPFLPGLECSTSSVVFGNGLRPCAFSIILNFNEILPFYFEWVNHMFAEILHALILSAHRQRPSPTSPTVSSLRTSQDTSHL